MPLIANPLRNPTAFDFIVVAGVKSPGIFELNGGERPYKWDVKDTAGAQGATITYRGWNLSTGIKGKFKFWTADQIDEFVDNFLPLLKYDATKKNPSPIQISYPALLLNDIRNVVTDSIGPLVDLGAQLWSVEVTWIEYAPAAKKNATTTPTSTTGSSPSKASQKPTALDEQDKQIQQLLIEAQKPI
jgi:hypothetical protein